MRMCCSVLQCVAVCCNVLQCVAVCCNVLQCVAVCSVSQCVEWNQHTTFMIHWRMCCSVLQCVAACCSVLQCLAVCCSVLQYVAIRQYSVLDKRMGRKFNVLQCVSVSWSVLQCGAVCFSVFWCVLVCCGVSQCVAMCSNTTIWRIGQAHVLHVHAFKHTCTCCAYTYYAQTHTLLACARVFVHTKYTRKQAHVHMIHVHFILGEEGGREGRPD